MVWGSMTHHRECYCAVSYPSEIHDTLSGPTSVKAANHTSWLRGWNFTTDLYRILERVMDVIATSRRRTSGIGPPTMRVLDHSIGTDVVTPSLSLASVMPYVNGMYDALPDTFKHVRPMTGDLETDIDSFQAANIVVTIYVSLVGCVALPVFC